MVVGEGCYFRWGVSKVLSDEAKFEERPDKPGNLSREYLRKTIQGREVREEAGARWVWTGEGRGSQCGWSPSVISLDEWHMKSLTLTDVYIRTNRLMTSKGKVREGTDTGKFWWQGWGRGKMTWSIVIIIVDVVINTYRYLLRTWHYSKLFAYINSFFSC